MFNFSLYHFVNDMTNSKSNEAKSSHKMFLLEVPCIDTIMSNSFERFDTPQTIMITKMVDKTAKNKLMQLY